MTHLEYSCGLAISRHLLPLGSAARAALVPRCPPGWATIRASGASLPTRCGTGLSCRPCCQLQGIGGAVRAYLELHDRPAGGRQEDEAALLAGMTPDEQKKCGARFARRAR